MLSSNDPFAHTDHSDLIVADATVEDLIPTTDPVPTPWTASMKAEMASWDEG